MKIAMIRDTAVTAFLLATMCYAPSLNAQTGVQPSSHSPTVSSAAVFGLPESKGPVEVRAGFHLLNINKIDDESETVTFSGVLTLTWKDTRQAFDPAKDGVSEKLYQGAYQFNEISPSWYPQATLVNASGMYESRAVLLRVKPDGTSTLTEAIEATSKVSLNMRKYPFDHQRLEVVFQILGFDNGEVVLQTEPKSVSVDPTIIRLPQWALEGGGASIRTMGAPYAGTLGVSSSFVVTMDVKRKSFFMLRLVVVPLFLIVMLSWVVFWMDRSSLGDRMSVSFVGILTAVAYQMVVSGDLPQIDYFTLMNGFLNLSLFLMCATVVMNLVVGAADKSGNLKLGDNIDRRCRWIFPCVYVGVLLIFTTIAFRYY